MVVGGGFEGAMLHHDPPTHDSSVPQQTHPAQLDNIK